MFLDRTDTSTHVLCAECQTYYKCTSEHARNFFGDSQLCPADLLADMEKPGINIVFDKGCLNCRPRQKYQISTSEPRNRMH